MCKTIPQAGIYLNFAFGYSVFHQASDIPCLCVYNSNEISSVSPDRFSHCTDIVLVNCGVDNNRADIWQVIFNPQS